MTSPDLTSTTLQVGVRLPLLSDRLGEWLAEAGAYDAAGAHAIWLEVGDETGLDPLALAAALAVTTFRTRLVLPVDAEGFPSPEAARILATVRRLSRNRVTLLAAGNRVEEISDRVAGIPVLTRGPRPGDSSPDDAQPEPFAAHGQGPDGQPERWLGVITPSDRDAWAQTVSEAAELGLAGVVVDADPVLIDILRNPDPTADRRDMHVATG